MAKGDEGTEAAALGLMEELTRLALDPWAPAKGAV